VRPDRDRPVEPVAGAMLERYLDAHPSTPLDAAEAGQ
jgi:hypothetical protein